MSLDSLTLTCVAPASQTNVLILLEGLICGVFAATHAQTLYILSRGRVRMNATGGTALSIGHQQLVKGGSWGLNTSVLHSLASLI